MKVKGKNARPKAIARKPVPNKFMQSEGGPTYNGPLKGLVCSLSDPFCTAAYGAKVPDEYTFPTEAVTLRHRYTVRNTDDGDYVVVTPNPLIGSFGMPTDTSAPPQLNAITGVADTVQISSVVSELLTLPVARPLAAGLQQSYSSFRVVGWGVRIRNITKAVDVAGDVTVAVLPCSGYMPPQFLNVLNSGALVARPTREWVAVARTFNLPTNSFSDQNLSFSAPKLAGLEGVALSDTYSGAELAQTGGIQVLPKLHSPGAAWRFRSTGGEPIVQGGPHAYTTSTTQGGLTASPPVIATTNLDPLSVEGHNCVVFQMPGSDASVGVTNVYEIEVVYHVEATPYVTGTSGLIPTANTASPIVPKAQVDSAMMKVWNSPWVGFIKHEAGKALGSLVQALPGLMTKQAMLGLML